MMEKMRIVYEKRPNDENKAYVVAFTLLFVALFGGVFLGVFSWLQLGDMRWLALTVASVVGCLVAWWRMLQHDERGFYIRETEVWDEEPVKETAVEEPRARIELQTAPHQWRYLKWNARPAQWTKLHDELLRHELKLSRDVMRSSGIFRRDEWETENGRQGVWDYLEKAGCCDHQRPPVVSDAFLAALQTPLPQRVNGQNGHVGAAAAGAAGLAGGGR